ncbi:ATP-dependent RNA helicase DHX30-like isoform X1 [Vespa crabro]|uniref:ATP-dependent RNA helicase DHX30-like isoform X1 n=1 Tax=Vespa crabro TaxID=7445 RepID=UPI001EFFD659|nr:ATP-dependent RNA helicase DHX30-like isoform X1 [Vespa crabro]XP_046827423.1 ATP-dependent RNA helicase DHX30-like isoform X1 [Vespa crabro]XP_046827424.1 ATP-dependent RNA helicase DHX30-like isoform X1 [Vespa crabro]XP_046827425.1 ATP-dependent RNA helicase DHX30-like isoform X1 [Vespa crabro]
MFNYRVIFYKKGRTCCFIRSQVAWPCESSNKQFYLNKIKRYYRTQNEEERKLVDNVAKINNSIHLEELKQPNLINSVECSNFTERLLEENEKKGYNSNKNVIYDTKLRKNEEVTFEDMFKLYPNSVSTLKNIYCIVMNELNINNLLRMDFTCSQNKERITWECICSVSWPTKESFTGRGTSKVLASADASLKCLYWLYKQNKLKANKPIIYTKEEIETKLDKTIPIYLDSTILEEVERLIEIYKENVKNIIESPKLKNNSSNESVDIDTGMTPSFLYNQTRNQSLKSRFLQNNVRTDDSNLPIFQYREKILEKLEKNNILLIRGNTGCGKTTQIPQFILDSYIKNGNATDCNILVSQPRRISAISLAERIASERGESIGDVIGFSVRLQKVYPRFPAGILFCTTGILCQIMEKNPNLIGYSHVILDEVHERTLDIDILFVLIKRALTNNSSLKLIIMSATINTKIFEKYFNCDTIDIEGKRYPVKMHFLEDFENLLPPLENKMNLNFIKRNINRNTNILMVNIQQVVSLIKWIIDTKPPGTILCFLPGWAEIKIIDTILNNDTSLNQKLLVIPLHSKLSIVYHHRIFTTVPKDTSKIILATDIVESGITIPDVIYVIDTSIKNTPIWRDNKLYMGFQKVSQANIQQRKGRAGRIQTGESYHFITKKEYDELHPNPIPEALCSSLEDTIIKIKGHTNEKIEQFCEYMIESPSKMAINKAIKTLMLLDIIDKDENLTPLGKRLSSIHVHPILGKALILSSIFKCTESILSIITLYSIEQDIFSNTLYNKSSKKDIKEQYHRTSDHLAIAKLCTEWKKRLSESDYTNDYFCNDMNISPLRIKLYDKIRCIISKQLQTCGIKNYDISDSTMLQSKDTYSEEIIYGIILSSTNMLLENYEFCYDKNMFRKKSHLKSECNNLVKIMTESVNYNKIFEPNSFLTYFHGVNFQNTHYMLVYDTSIISPLTILLFGQGSIYEKENNNSLNEKIIVLMLREEKPLKFSCTPEVAEKLMLFRNIIWSVVNYFLITDKRPHNEYNYMNEYRSEMLRVLSKMLDISAKNNDKKIK